MAKKPRTLPSKIWPLDKIKEYPHNPRTHPQAQIDLLAELLKKYGPDQDIVVDELGLILKGHGRKLAAKKAGRADFPVTQWLGLSEEDKIAIRIADNQVALLSGWDNALVGFEIERLKRSEFPISLLGFGDAQLVSFTTQPGPPEGGFPEFGADIQVDHQCPKCGYVGSGSWAPVAAKPPEEEKPVPRQKARAGKAAK